ncbi:MAG: hypothetical protein KGN33_04715 [Paracoccaceae bacterium]|nr:hypothetical protein [Paracoccaceae bacterium]
MPNARMPLRLAPHTLAAWLASLRPQPPLMPRPAQTRRQPPQIRQTAPVPWHA